MRGSGRSSVVGTRGSELGLPPPTSLRAKRSGECPRGWGPAAVRMPTAALEEPRRPTAVTILRAPQHQVTRAPVRAPRHVGRGRHPGQPARGPAPRAADRSRSSGRTASPSMPSTPRFASPICFRICSAKARSRDRSFRCIRRFGRAAITKRPRTRRGCSSRCCRWRSPSWYCSASSRPLSS